MRPGRPEDSSPEGQPEHPHRRDPRFEHWESNPWGPWAHGRGPHARWHRGHRPHGPWYRTRLGRYLHARLHRRIFVWFGLSIFITGVAVATVLNLVGGSSWRQNVEQMRTFTSNRFAEVWDAPQQRDALVEGIARDLSVDLELHDATGAVIRRAGAACDTPDYSIPVVRSGVLLGTVEACYFRNRPRRVWNFVAPLMLMGAMLWMLSGTIARRLTRPMDALVRAAAGLGAGKLATRVQLTPGATDEMAMLATSFNDMAARIERQMADQRELLAAVSHELRTPLAHLRVLTEILRDSGGDPKTLDNVDREVVELDALVGELLASSRLDFGQVTLRPLDATELASRALQRTGLPAELLAVEVSDSALVADATLLGRALANLLENARKHGQGAEALRIFEQEGRLAFCVDDRGPGLQPGEETRIFQPFYRKDRGAEAREAGSLGLGLALVQRIAKAHGGDVFAENRPGGGARVGFSVQREGPPAAVPPTPA